jgi:hypothetical protein
MRKLALAIYLVVAGTTFAQCAGETTASGFVTDTWCGRKGANEQHAEHARRSVASGVAQYALYDEASKKLYILAPQSTAAQYVGQRVQISGTLSTTPITRAGQSLAPDAVAAYKDPSAPNGLRASGATSGTSTAPGTIRTAAPTAALGNTARVQSHEDAPDQTTPVAGVLSISSVAAAPGAAPRRTSRPTSRQH